MALWTGVALAAARVADEFGLARDGCAGGKSLEADIVRRVDRLFVELGQKNVRDSADDTLGSAFNQVAKTYKNLAFTQADCRVQGCEAPKANRNWRDGRSWAYCTIFLFKNGSDVICSHQIRN